MVGIVDGRRTLAVPEGRAACAQCGGTLVATQAAIRIWHWAHEGGDCDPWSEPESDWLLGWKRHVGVDRAEVVVTRDGAAHRADVVTATGAYVELQDGALPAADVRARESHYPLSAWIFRATWADRLHYGKRGFWWRGSGGFAQSLIGRKLFWDFEDEAIVQEVRVARTEDGRGGVRVVGRAVKTYARGEFAAFLATGTPPEGKVA